MSIDDDRGAGEDGAQDRPALAGRWGRRRVPAAAGLLSLVILGGGAYLIAERAHDEKTTSSARITPPAPSTSTPALDGNPTPPPPASAAPPQRTVSADAPTSAAPSITTSSAGPGMAGPGMAEADAVETRTQALPNGTIHVTSARTDLAGKREQNLAADNGTLVGAARCTQKLKVIGGQPRKIPNMMLCWHTSPSRSVLTLQVTTSGSPSAGASVKVLDKAWAELG